MRRIALWMAASVVLLVLLLTYHTSLSGPANANVVAQGTQAPGLVGPATTPPTSGTPGTTAPTPAPSRSSGPTTAPKTSAKTTVNGSVADTPYGPIQVQVTIASGKITGVRTLTYPSGTGRDEEINSYALPVLAREVLAAQSANISTVSGATYTSEGYLQSLQAALDAAHFHS